VIELIPGSEPKLSKVYPLSLVEQKELDFFLEENLCTEQIYLLQMVTYLFVIGALESWKVQKCEV